MKGIKVMDQRIIYQTDEGGVGKLSVIPLEAN